MSDGKKIWKVPFYKINTYLGILFSLFAITIMLIGPSQIKGRTTVRHIAYDPLLFSQIVMVIILLNCMKIIYDSLRIWWSVKGIQEGEGIKVPFLEVKPLELRRILFFLLSLILYVHAIRIIGYTPSTLLIVAFSSYFIGERRPLKVLLLSIAVTAAIVFFARSLGFILPEGRLIYQLFY